MKGLALAVFALAYPAEAREVLIVAESRSATVSFIDVASQKHLGQLQLGRDIIKNRIFEDQRESGVHAVSVDPRRRYLAITSLESNGLTVVDLSTGKLHGQTRVGKSPHVPFFTPDGARIWVPNVSEKFLSVISVADMREVRRIGTRMSPVWVYFPPGANVAFVAYYTLPFVDVIDRATGKVLASIDMKSTLGATAIQPMPDGREIWVPLPFDKRLARIDTKRRALIESVPITGGVMHASFAKEGDTHVGFLARATKGEIAKLAFTPGAPGLKEVGNWYVGNRPHGVYTGEGGKKLFVTIELGDQIAVADTATMKEIARVPTGMTPVGGTIVNLEDPALDRLSLRAPRYLTKDVSYWRGFADGEKISGNLTARDLGRGTLHVALAVLGLPPGPYLAYAEGDPEPFAQVIPEQEDPTLLANDSTVVSPGKLLKGGRPKETIYLIPEGKPFDPAQAALTLKLADREAATGRPTGLWEKIRSFFRL